MSIDKIEFDPNQRELLRKWLRSTLHEDHSEEDYFTIADILKWSLSEGVIQKDEFDFEKYFDLAMNDSADHSAFISLSSLFKELGQEYVEKYSNRFKKLIMEYWEEMIDENISEDGVLDGYFYESEESEAYDSLHGYIVDNLSEYEIDFSEEDIDLICENCDVTQHIIDNVENASHEPDDFDSHSDRGYSTISEDAAIDDLFERT